MDVLNFSGGISQWHPEESSARQRAPVSVKTRIQFSMGSRALSELREHGREDRQEPFIIRTPNRPEEFEEILDEIAAGHEKEK